MREFLEYFNLEFTQAVFEPESGLVGNVCLVVIKKMSSGFPVETRQKIPSNCFQIRANKFQILLVATYKSQVKKLTNQKPSFII